MFNIAVDHIVLRLDGRQRMKLVFINNALRFLQAGTAPLLANAVIEYFSLGH